MEINYLDFLGKIKGKSVDEIDINEILKKDINYDLEITTITMIMGDLIDIKNLFDSDLANDIAELYMEKSTIFFHIIKQYTTLKLNNDDGVIDNYNIILEEALKTNPLVNRCYKEIEELISRKRMNVIEALSEALKEIPDIDDIEKMTNSFNTLFSEENRDSLKLLENITSYNDPSMKALKEVIYDASTDAIIKAEDINKKNNK